MHTLDRDPSPYLERLERAGHRLAHALTEIDFIIRIIQSKPDWLAQAEEEIAITERTLTYTLDKIKAARAKAQPTPPETCTLPLWRDWPAAPRTDETKFHELIAAVEQSNLDPTS
jgi:hypothetical protein